MTRPYPDNYTSVGDLVEFQQMGFGLAFAVLLDATVVRIVLVPSAMELLGDRNWYLPPWLHWLPDLRVQGASAEAAASRPLATGDQSVLSPGGGSE